MQLDHLSTSIYHNILIIIVLLLFAWGLTKFIAHVQAKQPQRSNPWFNRIIWLMTGVIIVGFAVHIGETGHHDYQTQTANYIKTRQTNVNKIKQLNQQIQITQDHITFNTVKMNQPEQSDKAIKKLIHQNDANQAKLTTYQTQLKAAQAKVKSISPQGVPQ